MASKMEEEFLKVYEAQNDAIFRYCYFRVYSREKARDLTQEAFIKAWAYIKEGKEVENLKAFIYRVANNLIIDDVRKKKETSLDALAENGFDPSIGTTASEEQRIDGIILIETLQHLDEEYRDVVYMRYIENLQPREIAEILNESVNAISVRIHRGLKKLKKILNDRSARSG